MKLMLLAFICNIQRSSDIDPRFLLDFLPPFSLQTNQVPGNLIASSKLLFESLSTNFSVCEDNQGLRVLLVLSRLSFNNQREVIRSTYANYSLMEEENLKNTWVIYFVVGRPQSEKEAIKIYQENQKYNDIITVNSHEGYYFLTLKMLVAYKILDTYCSKAKYVAKVDDDIYVKIKKLDDAITAAQNTANSRVGYSSQV